MTSSAERSATPSPLIVNISSNMNAGTKITNNLDQDVHVTTRDKVELALRTMLPKYTSTEQWVAAIGLFVALLTTLVTADFNNKFGVTGAQWSAVFGVAATISAFWLVHETIRWLRRPSLINVVDEVLRKPSP